MAIHWSSRNAGAASRSIAILFAAGSACFLVAPFPGFADLAGAEVVGIVFFAGSLLFTLAAFFQLGQSRERDRTPAMIVFVGTLLFDVGAFRAMSDAFDDDRSDQLVWSPDPAGSLLFLLAAALAYLAVRGARPRGSAEWRVAVLSLAGSALFCFAAFAAYAVPETGGILDLAPSNWATVLGALCFLAASLLLLPRSRSAANGVLSENHVG